MAAEYAVNRRHKSSHNLLSLLGSYITIIAEPQRTLATFSSRGYKVKHVLAVWQNCRTSWESHVLTMIEDRQLSAPCHCFLSTAYASELKIWYLGCWPMLTFCSFHNDCTWRFAGWYSSLTGLHRPHVWIIGLYFYVREHGGAHCRCFCEKRCLLYTNSIDFLHVDIWEVCIPEQGQIALLTIDLAIRIISSERTTLIIIW